MNRRDALKALATLGGATGITVTPVSTQEAAGVELVLLKTPEPMSPEEVAELRAAWRIAVAGTALADARSIVLDSGLEVEVVRAGKR